MIKPDFPNLLLIAGTGRNVGKTSFAERTIRKLSIQHEIIAIKISKHYHDHELQSLKISKEENPETGKDSSRFLNAGAKEVYYIQAKDNNLPELANSFLNQLPRHIPIIVESGGIIDHIEPGLFILIQSSRHNSTKETAHYKERAHLIINSQREKFDIDPECISFDKISKMIILKNQ